MNEERRTCYLMGTVIKLWVQHEQADELLPEAENRLIDYEKRFSANDDASELMVINHQAGVAPVKADDELFELIQLGKKHSLPKDSFLNIAIGPLIQAWRIGFDNANRPSDQMIQLLLQRIDPQNIYINEEAKTVFLEKKGMSLDLGAIAKGYFADKLLTFFKENGVYSALIDLGGNVLTYGPAPKHEDGCWRIGIQSPFSKRGELKAVVKVKDKSVVTSGIYERMNTINGQTFHHIFDQETGFPLETNLASVTIVSAKSVDGEIWTTRLFGKQPDEIIDILNQADELDGLVITKDGQLHFSEALEVQIVQ
ncbi:FAD:protein FMN transferase [Tetragenococcus halophilus]|uniref:FAD:protein FMN transferase n=1 Tax=Tetragenococcus halophilus TaxID=51669 RepID=A0A3G5FGR6_TETHA|nr:FAD:protein FMN transferase [Tetragenococcus halophilus]AOF48142.1 thiamine biosynthesis protein ApbE [Tetragenococcus halophilus]AYW49520.1 FAD:protein FMN transferase [Tetragenococcus halophilus]MCF1602456.1 FAD:protein FMN transferase [Tetragenococcus halophilus]MCO7025795.1 FAD:protein FMN transferase [Tetragenococcus halophilus]MCO8283586.1 FAD:protein FMN transferase [Tetragenococcus halophilus]